MSMSSLRFPRHATVAATFVLAVALSAGCSSSSPEIVATNPGGGKSADASATPTSPLSGLSTQEIWKKTKANIDSAKSVHIAATFAAETASDEEVRLNFKMTTTGKAFGTFQSGKDRVSIRRLGDVLYFKANRSFWDEDGSEPVEERMAGRWLKATRADKTAAEFYDLSDLDFFFKDAFDVSVAEMKDYHLVAGPTVAGGPTIGLADTAPGEETKDSGTLFIASTGPSLPTHLKLTLDDEPFMKFRGWNEPVRVVAPKGAVSLSSLI